MPPRTPSLLIIADSDRDADMLYGTGLFVPDPFIFVRKADTVHLVLSDLEFDRATRTCPTAVIHSFTALRQKAIQLGIESPSLGHLAHLLLKQLRLNRVQVPPNFPLHEANILQSAPSPVTLSVATPFPERTIKSATEITKIKRILQITEQGLDAGIALISKAKITSSGRLEYRQKPLTSEAVRGAIHAVISSHGGLPANTIVAGGNQGCDPHERGHGPLRAHQPIIIDVFPRSETTGYFGDITRTVVRGRASEAVKKIYHAVGQAQEVGMKRIRHGESGSAIHSAVENVFESLGFETGSHKGRRQGFFHGTGHGLGLDIHESPGIGKTSTNTLQAGNVVTVEPGLYYPGIGGVRLEDVVVVKEGRPRKLTRYRHHLEI